jgi:hypothetical protein
MSRFIGSRSWSRNDSAHNSIVVPMPPWVAMPLLNPSADVKTM